MNLDKITNDRKVTTIAGTGRVGDPATYALAASLGDAALADKNAGPMAIVVPDQAHGQFWKWRTRYDTIRRTDREGLGLFVAPNGWVSGQGITVGGEVSGGIANFDAETVVIVDHPDTRKSSWRWVTSVAKADRCIVISTAATGDEDWRLFNGAKQKADVMTLTLADDERVAATLTVKGFDSQEVTRLDFTWGNGGKLDDVDAWRQSVADAVTEAEQEDARKWFIENHRPTADEIPPVLLKAAPWLAKKETNQ